MNAGIEFAFEPLRSEILQLELLFRQIAKVLPTVVMVGIPVLFGLVWLLAALDCMSQKDRNAVRAHEATQESEGVRSQTITRFGQNEHGAAA